MKKLTCSFFGHVLVLFCFFGWAELLMFCMSPEVQECALLRVFVERCWLYTWWMRCVSRLLHDAYLFAGANAPSCFSSCWFDECGANCALCESVVSLIHFYVFLWKGRGRVLSGAVLLSSHVLMWMGLYMGNQTGPAKAENWCLWCRYWRNKQKRKIYC